MNKIARLKIALGCENLFLAGLFKNRRIRRSIGFGGNRGFHIIPALVVDDAEHRGPDCHEDDEEGEEQKAGHQLSFAAFCGKWDSI